jgi:hypothetical protein
LLLQKKNKTKRNKTYFVADSGFRTRKKPKAEYEVRQSHYADPGCFILDPDPTIF